MPLLKGKSQKDSSKDMEMDKPQSLAVAYNVQRRAGKKMAKGGPVTESSDTAADPKFMTSDEQDKALRDGKPLKDLYNPKPEMAEGGMVAHGELDNEESGQSPYDDDNAEAYDHDSYDDDQLGPQPHDSNLMGDSHEMDTENKADMDLISRIRERMRNRRGF